MLPVRQKTTLDGISRRSRPMLFLLLPLLAWLFTAGPHLHAQAHPAAKEINKRYPGPRQLYKAAKLSIYSKEWKKSIALFITFKTQYPSSTYYDDSLYYLGYSLHQWSLTTQDPAISLASLKEAMENLDILVTKHKKSAWTDDARVLKVKVAALLVQKGQKEYLFPILEILQKPKTSDPGLLIVALDNLIQLDINRAVPHIKSLLDNPPNDQFTSKITLVLGKYQDKRLQALLNRVVREKPRWVRKVEPDYPLDALKLNIQGDVLLEVTTDARGNVTGAKVLKGHKLLRDAAIKAVKQWKHEPAPIDGKDADRVFTVTINFDIY